MNGLPAISYQVCWRCASNAMFRDLKHLYFFLNFLHVTGWRYRDRRGSSGPDWARHHRRFARVFRHIPIDETDHHLRRRLRRRSQGMVQVCKVRSTIVFDAVVGYG